LALEFLLARTILVAFGQEHGNAECTTPRDDADFVDRIMFRNQSTHNGMACFVVCGDQLFIFAHHCRLAFSAHQDLVLGLLEVIHFNFFLVLASSKKSCFIHQVGKISARESRGTPRQPIRFDVGSHRDTFHVYTENLLAAADIGQTHCDLAIKATRA